MINFSSGTLTFDTTHGFWTHTSGVHGTGVIEQNVDNGITYKTCAFTFDSINLSSGLTVVLQGENSLILKTRNHGNITVGTNLNANGGDADTNYPAHYSMLYQGLGRLGGYNGGYRNSSNGYGPGAGKFKGGGISGNLVGGGVDTVQLASIMQTTIPLALLMAMLPSPTCMEGLEEELRD